MQNKITAVQVALNYPIGRPTDLVLSDQPGSQKDLVQSKRMQLADDSEMTILYDLSMLEAISQGNKEFVRHMIQLFCTETPMAASQMIAAYESGDFKRVRHIAHRIRPSIENMGINSQKEVLRRIEHLAQLNDESGELKMLIVSFDKAINKVALSLLSA
ncbi:Hpt domain-containing protein [Spirosoma sp. KNUC1025]|uniref:Hpt domain-containing protein n=1 Tax=Spirosoma sp. KNUC1025 TaxID=2894082 RepID=UPI0038652178|nr:Hpt domain-containing protein [Spirosoma sp. KNUC1025]